MFLVMLGFSATWTRPETLLGITPLGMVPVHTIRNKTLHIKLQEGQQGQRTILRIAWHMPMVSIAVLIVIGQQRKVRVQPTASSLSMGPRFLVSRPLLLLPTTAV